MPHVISGTTNQPTEMAFSSDITYQNATMDVELDVIFTHPDGQTSTVPAYWAGRDEWRVRFSPGQAGSYSFHTICSDMGNARLHGREGELRVKDASGKPGISAGSSICDAVPGALRVAGDGRSLECFDGEPFFWLADTWWMGLCSRLVWPGEFQELAQDRKRKGFSVIQIVAGLYPDMPYGDMRGANEAGFPWSVDYSCIYPEYFDMADLRISYLVSTGLVPCIVGCWGYHLLWMGIDAMKKHWRYLIARWGAYPVVWCLAGEGAMPYYLSKDPSGDRTQLVEGWTELAKYVRQIDSHKRLVTIHPTDASRRQVTDADLLDFEMLQTGHSGFDDLGNTVRHVRLACEERPKTPAIVAEVCYEGIMEGCREEVQRVMFWSSVLSGACGHTYGANGIWQLNRPDQPYGPSPHGASWGDTPWQEAYKLPGSTHVGVGRRILEAFEWWKFEPRRDWVMPGADSTNPVGPYAAGIERQVRMVYFPVAGLLVPWAKPINVCNLEPDVDYNAAFIDPKTGKSWPLGRVSPEADGSWRVPNPHIMQDWLLVLLVDSLEMTS